MRKLANGVRQSLETAAQTYAESLGTACKAYLTGRGFTDVAISVGRLGEVVTPEPGHEHFVGRLCIPYLTTSGVVDLKFRCIKHTDCKQHDCVKYLGLDGSAQDDSGLPRVWLYNAQTTITAKDLVVITEGELDALAVETIADVPAVGVPGSTLWAKCRHWRRVFDGLRVLVVADGDKAGVLAAKAIASSLPDARVVRMPDGEDANSFLLALGPQAFYDRCGI